MKKVCLQFFMLSLVAFIASVSTAFSTNIQLSADAGLEWNQNTKLITAKKNAEIKRNDMTLLADIIIAKYREKGSQKEVYEATATGNVLVTSTKQKITADKLVYNMDKNVLTMTSVAPNISRIESGDTIVEAKGKIVYFEKENRINVDQARVLNSGRQIVADTVVVYLKPESAGSKNLVMDKVVANKNVVVTDQDQKIFGDQATFNQSTGFANITGKDVKIQKGTNAALSGGEINYNMRTGIAKMVGNKGGAGRVTGVFISPGK